MQHACHLGMAFSTPIPLIPSPTGQLMLAPVTTQWHRARRGLQQPTNFSVIELLFDGMEIGEAREAAIRGCLQHEPRPEFLFFLDYDVIPMFDAMTKLVMRARHFPEHDIFAGVYCSKSRPAEPLIYGQDGEGPFWKWDIGDLLCNDEIHGCHMGLTLIRMSMFDRFKPEAWETPMFHTTNEQELSPEGTAIIRRGTEDLFFCARVTNEIKARILVDTSVLAGHINNTTGELFGIGPDCKPGKTRWLTGGKKYADQKKAIDLGAGPTRRQWPKHRTYTTDLRPDVGADYDMDSRLINLPDNHFDLVASSHHLEHIPRWEQEQVWKQIHRICKPGGFIEHVVPNIGWAAAMVVDGEEDEHVQNVLYGAQEAHDYERTLNLHYFGYTPRIAMELAKEVGFVDVSTESYQDAPQLGYNLIIRGRKLRVGEKPPKPPRAKRKKRAGKKTKAKTKKGKSNGVVRKVSTRAARAKPRVKRRRRPVVVCAKVKNRRHLRTGRRG